MSRPKVLSGLAPTLRNRRGNVSGSTATDKDFSHTHDTCINYPLSPCLRQRLIRWRARRPRVNATTAATGRLSRQTSSNINNQAHDHPSTPTTSAGCV